MSDNSFIFFIKERSEEMNDKGFKDMALSMNHSLWSLDVVKSSIPSLIKDGFNVRLDPKTHKLETGEDAIELILVVEWK